MFYFSLVTVHYTVEFSVIQIFHCCMRWNSMFHVREVLYTTASIAYYRADKVLLANHGSLVYRCRCDEAIDENSNNFRLETSTKLMYVH